MTKTEIKELVNDFLKDIKTASISMGDDSGDTAYGSSDLTCREGEIMHCRALSNDGSTIEFDILAHGLEFEMIGKAAGAF
jgi:hypothetical protein